jgi:hypothetical protein
VLFYRCPATNQQVQSEIETTPQTLQRLRGLKLSLWCPHCNTDHIICADETSVERWNFSHPTQGAR